MSNQLLILLVNIVAITKQNILHGKLAVYVTKSGVITKRWRRPENHPSSYTLHKLNVLTEQKEAALAGVAQWIECLPAN